MSYLAIARKYRPATFEQMVGQDHVTRTLTHAIERDRIHHAFLFCGPRGVGKTTAARALAKALNCVQGPTPTPCGECTSCVEISAGTSPDLIEIDGASNNSVDNIRELRETVRYLPTQGRRKIYLVDEVHMLSTAAFNALLKTLEEPPAHVIFLFATTEPGKIPDTILSRVQRFDFKRIPVTEVAARLGEIAQAEGATLSEVGLRMIARAGEGSMRDAQSLLDKVISFAGKEVGDDVVAETLGLVDRGLIFDMLEGLVTGKPEACLDVIARVYDYGHELARFSSDLLELVRHATFVGLSDEARAHVDLPDEEIARLAALAEHTDTEALTRLFSALMEVHEDVARSAHARIVLEMAVARLASIRPVVPVGQLVARLEGLERRLRQSGATPSGGGNGGRGGRDAGRRAGPSRAQRTPGRSGARARRRGAASTLADDAPDDERWSAFQADLKALEPPVPALAAGMWRRQDDTLVVTVEAGRGLASSRRAKDRPDVQALLARCFGEGVRLDVEASLASQSPDVSSELEARVLADPTIQQALRIFSATLDDVRADTEDSLVSESLDPIREAVRQLRRLPGIGEKTATRLVYWLLRAEPGTPAALADALVRLGDQVRTCATCGDLTAVDPCSICADTRRDTTLLCVVEQPQDVLAFERSGEFRGRYHVLHGAISPLDGVGPDDLNLRPLLERLRHSDVVEVILATDPDVEGDATALYLARLLADVGVTVSRLAHGISVGTEIEYADAVTLGRALHNRQRM